MKNVRSLLPETFNTPATRQEIEEVLAVMDRQRHVNRELVRLHLNPDDRSPYVLTLGKLFGLADTRLGWGARELAKQLGVEVEHPIKPEARRVG